MSCNASQRIRYQVLYLFYLQRDLSSCGNGELPSHIQDSDGFIKILRGQQIRSLLSKDLSPE